MRAKPGGMSSGSRGKYTPFAIRAAAADSCRAGTSYTDDGEAEEGEEEEDGVVEDE